MTRPHCARTAIAQEAAHAAATRYVAAHRAAATIRAHATAPREALEGERAHARTCVQAYTALLRAQALRPERALVLVKQAVLVETTPGPGADRRGWEALHADVAPWFVEAYFAG